ncbi:hypothetical protein [Ornithinibacillus halophilus]|uniref:Uncharacterized protein n=1 Tax=Ornithinibacillus halophilus TaxID=930117 RepID=A0A1M5LRA4_9BACI|nr:hypothetical protein [Ornithinibacillus halophilus]SHG66893.1 hypothetical protein SAMN05216225_104910 [Ornithinibacillus halophilus]
MIVVFLVYALIILFIFNSLTQKFCTKLEMNSEKQASVFRVINIMILILLVSSYLRVLNAMS